MRITSHSLMFMAHELVHPAGIMILRLPTIIVLASIFAFSFPRCNTQANNVQSQKIDSLIEIQKLNEECILVKFGADAITAINTQKGIVLIDAGISSGLTARYRKIIENEFARNDFAYLINSHGHPDHFGGNSVFTGSRIVGHTNCLNEFTEKLDSKSRIESISKIVEDYNKQLQTCEPDSKEWNEVFTQKIRYQNAYWDAKNSIPYVKPNSTFSDSLIIDMGDITFELIYFGKCHSDSDILIYVPEMSILFTGDLFFSYGRPSLYDTSIVDKEEWQRAVQWIERRISNIDTIVGGHGQILSIDDLKSFTSKIKNKSIQ